MKICVTGSSGLIGTELTAVLTARGDEVVPFNSKDGRDVRDPSTVDKIIPYCDGVVHLAAVSRVVWGERDPLRCYQVNVTGTCNVLSAVVGKHRKPGPRPWFILASSREVYGEPQAFPVTEDHPRLPINIYGHAKLAAEAVTLAARREGIRTAVARFSNVYGSIFDHADRVVPAFCRAAATGADLRVDGSDHTFDFTHVSDTADGIVRLINVLSAGIQDLLSPIHFLPGAPTSLGELAAIAVAVGGRGSKVVEAPPRGYDVARFYGDPSLARALLGWRAKVPVVDGVAALVRAFKVLA